MDFTIEVSRSRTHRPTVAGRAPRSRRSSHSTADLPKLGRRRGARAAPAPSTPLDLRVRYQFTAPLSSARSRRSSTPSKLTWVDDATFDLAAFTSEHVAASPTTTPTASRRTTRACSTPTATGTRWTLHGLAHVHAPLVGGKVAQASSSTACAKQADREGRAARRVAREARQRRDRLSPCRPRSSSGSTSTRRSSRAGLCTGCAGCVIACPHDVLGYRRRPGHLQAVPARGGLRRPTTAATARRAAPAAPGRAPGSGRGSPRSTSTCSAASREPEEVSGIYKDIVLARASRPGAPRGRPGRRARVGDPPVLPREGHHRRRARRRTSRATAPRGRRCRASPAPRRTSSPRPAAATRTPRTRWRTPRRSRAARSASRSSA